MTTVGSQPPCLPPKGDGAPPSGEPGATHETELKLALRSAADAGRLAETLPPPTRLVTQHNLFLDTATHVLAESRWALRLRLEREEATGQERALLAWKGPTRRIAGAVHRVDVEAPVEPALWHRTHREGHVPLATLTGPAATCAREVLPSDALLHVRLAFENRRDVHCLELAGAERELLLDTTRFASGEEDHELEVELTLPGPADGPEALLLIVAVRRDLEALLAAAGVRPAPPAGGKLTRALAYAARAGK